MLHHLTNYIEEWVLFIQTNLVLHSKIPDVGCCEPLYCSLI